MYNLDFGKVRDVSIKTEAEIQNAHVSSVGGAIGGAVLFGPLGAVIGGRVKKKTSKSVSDFLIFTYDNEGEVAFTVFEATGKLASKKFIEAFDRMEKEKKNIEL